MTQSKLWTKLAGKTFVVTGSLAYDYERLLAWADGYRRLAGALYQDVIQGYQVFQQARLGDTPSAR